MHHKFMFSIYHKPAIHRFIIFHFHHPLCLRLIPPDTGFLDSGTTLTNMVSGYDVSNFQLSSDKVTSYTISGYEFQNVITNWQGTSARLGTAVKPIVQGKTYLVRLKVKPSVDNYFLSIHSFYDEGLYDNVKMIDSWYMSNDYNDISFIFTADRNSNNFIVTIWDNVDGHNATQKAFNAIEFAIIDFTDALNE
jgi:hypothetical protein